FVIAIQLNAQIPDGFTPLFNEKDLTGWKRIGTSIPANVWTWEDGMLKTTQGSKGGAGWIQFEEKKYTDFQFYCEWKCNYNGNSGFQFHISDSSKQPVWDAIEIQFCDNESFSWWWEKNGYFKNDPRQITGAVYGFAGSSENMYNGTNNWNTALVTSIGDTIKVELNGKEVVNINRNDYTDDIVMWKPRIALSKRPKTGYIGLQSHKGGTTWYRHLAIKDLSK
ncbi:MAG: DUF1080 domain-containing protein, partial [Bacteroidales bacterium]|nr:DUF1080 domain-containing protein [Bacteroidales bacterium]